jgi:hypothetical protein
MDMVPTGMMPMMLTGVMPACVMPLGRDAVMTVVLLVHDMLGDFGCICRTSPEGRNREGKRHSKAES